MFLILAMELLMIIKVEGKAINCKCISALLCPTSVRLYIPACSACELYYFPVHPLSPYVMQSSGISRNSHVTFSVFYLIEVLTWRGTCTFC